MPTISPANHRRLRSPAKRRASSSPRKKKFENGNFIAFSKKHRAEVVAAHPTWKVTQVAKELGKRWRALPLSERKKYQL